MNRPEPAATSASTAPAGGASTSRPGAPAEPPTSWRPLFWSLSALFVALLWRAARGGPDLGHYLDWGEAARFADIFRLRGVTQSPMGLPASVWAHGAGLLLATPRLVLSDVAGDRAYLLVGCAAAVTFWWAMVRLLVLAASGDVALVMLGTALAFVGTNAGHYSTVHATESLSLGLVAALAWLVADPAPRRLREGLAVGFVSALLMVTRPQLLPYAALAIGILLVRWHADGALAGKRGIAGLLLVTVPLVVSGAQIALVNRWMTGSILASPWSFRSASFASMDWRDPEWLAVLFHPWHGLLLYHPLFAIGVAATVAAIVRPPTLAPHRLLHVGIAAVLLTQLLIQAAWFCWWMGIGSFGMRSMAVSAVPLVPVLIAMLARRAAEGRSNRACLAACGAAALWSWLLLLQGETNFSDLRALLAGQGAALRAAWPSLVGVGGALLLRIRREASSSYRVRTLAAGLWALAVVHLVDQPRFGLPLASPPVLLAGAAALALLLDLAFARIAIGSRPSAAAPHVLVLVSGFLFLSVTLSFVRIALATERFVAGGQPPPRAFTWVNPVPYEQIEASLREYARVEGFDERKARLSAYLEQVRRNSAGRAPLRPKRRRG